MDHRNTSAHVPKYDNCLFFWMVLGPYTNLGPPPIKSLFLKSSLFHMSSRPGFLVRWMLSSLLCKKHRNLPMIVRNKLFLPFPRVSGGKKRYVGGKEETDQGSREKQWNKKKFFHILHQCRVSSRHQSQAYFCFFHTRKREQPPPPRHLLPGNEVTTYWEISHRKKVDYSHKDLIEGWHELHVV